MLTRRLTAAIASMGAAAAMTMGNPVPAVAAAGVHPDFNGDGRADLPVPAPGEDHSGAANAGVIHVLYGSATGPRTAGSQRLSQATPGSVGTPGVAEFFGNSWTWGDFDGDGYDDLAVGIIGEHVDGRAAGGVQVFYGSAAGLTTVGDQRLSEGLPDFPGEPLDGQLFGLALAAGDFDDDGRDDLAVGDPTEAWGGGTEYGTVFVFHGRSSGLSTAGVERFNEATPGIAGAAENADRFGMSLAAGDFDHDGDDDLAIGAPGEAVGVVAGAGAVYVLNGGGVGLMALGSDVWSQGSAGVPGTPSGGDRFGASLAAGRFDGDARDDLAIGVTGDRVGGVNDAGAVVVMRGRDSGMTGLGAVARSHANPGVRGLPAPSDLLGARLAAGDFDGDGHDDLAVGAMMRSVAGAPLAGEVVVLSGSAGAVPLDGPARLLHQESAGIADVAEAGDMFSGGLAAGDFDGDGRDDLCIGVGGENFAGLDNAGLAHVVFGTSTGLRGAGSMRLTQNTPSMPDVGESGDIFGAQALG